MAPLAWFSPFRTYKFLPPNYALAMEVFTEMLMYCRRWSLQYMTNISLILFRDSCHCQWLHCLLVVWSWQLGFSMTNCNKDGVWRWTVIWCVVCFCFSFFHKSYFRWYKAVKFFFLLITILNNKLVHCNPWIKLWNKVLYIPRFWFVTTFYCAFTPRNMTADFLLSARKKLFFPASMVSSYSHFTEKKDYFHKRFSPESST